MRSRGASGDWLRALLLCSIVGGCGGLERQAEVVGGEAWSERVARHAQGAVLRVISDGGGAGSGFVIHPSGLAVTNAHVVSNAEGGRALFVGGEMRYEVLAIGASRDLALLRLQGEWSGGALQLGGSRGMALGAPVLTIGAPQGMFPVVTTGVLGGRSRPGMIADLLVPEQLIHGAPTLRGSSGCAILDRSGRVIGVQSAKPGKEVVKAVEAEDEAGRRFDRDLGRWRFQTEAYGLAVPVEDIRMCLPAWVAPEWCVGLETGFVCDPMGAGAVIQQVVVGSPAERAGLLLGDRIVGVGEDVVWSVVDLAVWLRRTGVLELSVERDGARHRVALEREAWARPNWGDLEPGLLWREARGRHERMPDFTSADVVEVGAVEGVGIPAQHVGQTDFVLELMGWLDVPEDGEWVFELESDDGSQLYVRDRLVVDVDGLHAARAAQGVVALDAGPQPVRVLFFQSGGDMSLVGRWGKVGEELVEIPSDRLGHVEGHGW